jgi:hypothetical protein
MLARDVRIEDFDTRDWVVLGDILGARARSRAVAEPSSGLLVLVEGERVLKVVSTTAGRLEPVAKGALSVLAAEHGATWAVRVSRRALATFSERFGARIERADDFAAQAQKLRDVIAELVDEGACEFHPKNLLWPSKTAERALVRAIDACCPVGKAVVVAAFDGDDVDTCITLHRGPHGFDRVVGPERARRELGLRTGDFSRDAKQLARAVELAVGPLALGLFARTATWKELVTDTTPGAWATAVAARDVVIHPFLPAVAIPLGVDVGRAAYVVARDLAERWGVASLVSGRLDATFDRVRGAAQRGDFGRFLGFDPIALIRQFFEDSGSK